MGEIFIEPGNIDDRRNAVEQNCITGLQTNVNEKNMNSYIVNW